MNRRTLAFAAVVAAMTGIVAGWSLNLQRAPMVSEAPRSIDQPIIAQPTATVLPRDLRQAQPGELLFKRVISGKSGTTAETCLEFTAPLDSRLTYHDYLTLPRSLKAAVRVDGTKLCLSGLPFGAQVPVTLKRGLPGANGETLAAAQALTLGTTDRAPMVAMGSGFLMPRHMPDGLPVTSVNVDKLAIQVHRIGERNLRNFVWSIGNGAVSEYRREDLEDSQATLVWKGTMPVSGPRNEPVISLFPFDSVIDRKTPGVYLVTANPDGVETERWEAMPSQWVVQSDLGLTAITGDDGLTVVVRSLASAKPRPGVTLALISRGNDELIKVTTDAAGLAKFDAGWLRGQGAAAPLLVRAQSGDDFNFLALNRPGLDLSDRGVDGRAASGPVDGFLYTDRGIYRPGETVHLVAMLRDRTAKAVEAPTIVKLLRPDGREFRRFPMPKAVQGSSHLPLVLPANAPRGLWAAKAFIDPKGQPVGWVSFDVQDFVPQKLAIDLPDPPQRLKAGSDVRIAATGRFLYGAPAAGLTGEGEMIIGPNPTPFPDLPGYRWGKTDPDFGGLREDLSVAPANAQGHTIAEGHLPAIASPQLLQATIRIGLHEPGGRVTSQSVRIPVVTTPTLIGIKPRFGDKVETDSEAIFDLITVDADGQAIARKDLSWRLLRDVSDWQWYRVDGTWRFERIFREQEIASGTTTTTGRDPAVIQHKVSWGRYRLEATDRNSGAITSVDFTAGWYDAETSADRPDRLDIAANKSSYTPGETARLHIDSRVDGEGLLVIANDRVWETRNIAIAKGGTDITIPIKDEWGSGTYALVTLFRPIDKDLGHAPARSVGVAWLGMNATPRTLNVEILSPPQVTPRQTVTVPVQVSGGNTAHVTLAAVDQGILQVTRFQSPQPLDHYFAKRRLAATLRDDYGRLIRSPLAQNTGEGGDGGFGAADLSSVPIRTVALFSGIVAVDDQGMAHVPLDIPDFQGELRLMAVAFDSGKIGATETPMTVRDPVVTDLILPRFLAPNDVAGATITLHNIAGAAGDYRISLTGNDPIDIAATDRTVKLGVGQRQQLTIPVTGRASGAGELTLRVRGPDGFDRSQSWPITVRPPQVPGTWQTETRLPPGGTLTLGTDVLSGYAPGAQIRLNASPWRGMNIPALLSWLDRYPHGCLEQTASRILPLLYLNQVAISADLASDAALQDRVQKGLDRMLAMQKYDGGFGMWNDTSYDADPWITLYALDVLQRAEAAGYDVPAAALRKGQDWIRRQISDFRRPQVFAYGLLLQSRANTVSLADLRYAAALTDGDWTALARAQIGTALARQGENDLAEVQFELAIKHLLMRRAEYSAYGGRLRQVFSVAATLAEAGQTRRVDQVLGMADGLDTDPDATSTQDKAWMLLTAAEMLKHGVPVTLSINDTALAPANPISLEPTADQLSQTYHLRNDGDADAFVMTTITGTPMDMTPPPAKGISLTKQMFTPNGQTVNLEDLRQNDRVVVVIAGEATDKVQGEYAILDLLPPGLEIEAVLKPNQPGFSWLEEGLLPPPLQEARDDRFIAGMSLPMDNQGDPYLGRDDTGDHWKFRIAYVARAVSPGTFILPGAIAEHMYFPRVQARSNAQRLTIGK